MTGQHAFVREFSKQSPTAMQIWTWHKKIKEEGCLCITKGSGQPKTSAETIQHVRRKIFQSLKKSLCRTSLETKTPQTTVWHILREHLIMKPYKLQLFQAITAEDKRKRKPNRCVLCVKRNAYRTCVESAMKSTCHRVFGGIILILLNTKPA